MRQSTMEVHCPFLSIPAVLLLAALALAVLPLEAGAFSTHNAVATGSKFSWIWGRVEAGGFQPSPREGHAAVEVGNKIFIFGGCVQGIRCFNDIYIFDTDKLSWSQERFTGDAPEPRGGHSATLVGTDIFVFGGASSETTYGDAYKLDLVQRHWTRAVPSGCPAVPSRRTNHAAVADAHGRIYIVGGYDAESNFLNDMWILNVYSGGIDKWEDAGSFPIMWEKPAPTGQAPEPREGHSLTLVDRKLVLFGGYTNAGTVANDVHVYNLDSQEWLRATVAGAMLPAPRQAHSAARHGRDVVIAGGCSVSEAHPECYNDVWRLNTIDMQWNKMSTDMVSWFAREGHTAIFVRGRMFTFGGCQLTSECFNDVAVLDTSEPCPSMCSGHGTCMNGQFCRCSDGFTGHDCMQPLTCPKDCSGHGQCTQGGTCACANGWGGADCSIDIPCAGSPIKCFGHGKCLGTGQCQCFQGYAGNDCSMGSAICPRDCSGRGYCNPSSQCVCQQGFVGLDCNTPLLNTLAAWKPSLNLQEVRMRPITGQQALRFPELNGRFAVLPTKNLGLAVARTRHAQSYMPHKKDVVAAPTSRQFGIPEVNDIGHTGVQQSDCDDNCNFRGVCQDGKCFCQPGFYGKKCQIVKTSKKGTISLTYLLLIGGACAAVSFAIMSLLLHFSMQSKRAKETELGYNI